MISSSSILRASIAALPLALAVAWPVATTVPARAQEASPSLDSSAPAGLPKAPELPKTPQLPKAPELPKAPAIPGAETDNGASDATGEAAAPVATSEDGQSQPVSPSTQIYPSIPASAMPFPTSGMMAPPLASVAPATPPEAVPPPSPLIKMGAGVKERWTDNAYLSSTGQRSDFISTIDPDLGISHTSQRLNVGLNYDLAYDRYIENPRLSGLRHNGLGSADAELIKDFLFLDARGSISEQPVNPTAANTAGTRTSATNNSLVSTYSVSPAIQQRLGRWALARISYTHNQTFSSSDTSGTTTGLTSSQSLSQQATASAATDDSAKIQLHSGDNFSRLLWDYTGDRQNHFSNETTNK